MVTAHYSYMQRAHLFTSLSDPDTAVIAWVPCQAAAIFVRVRRPVTQKLIRVKSDPAGSLLVAIIDPAGSLLAAKSDPPLQKVIRVQILVDSSLF